MRSGCALVDFGADTTTISVYKNNILRYLTRIAAGWQHHTRDITSLQMEEQDAEKLKLQYGNALYEEEEESETPAVCALEDGRAIELATLNNIIGARSEEILATYGTSCSSPVMRISYSPESYSPEAEQT